MKEKLFRLTPVGNADRQLREYVQDEEDGRMERYEKELSKYRSTKMVQLGLLALLYGGLATSIATTVGLGGTVEFVQQIASYIGTGILLVAYLVTRYLTMLYHESYHIRREILLAEMKRK